MWQRTVPRNITGPDERGRTHIMSLEVSVTNSIYFSVIRDSCARRIPSQSKATMNMAFFWSCYRRHFRGIGDPWWRHALDCLFSSGSRGRHPVSSIIRTRQTKASPSRSWWLTCILEVSVGCHKCTSVRLCGTYMHRFSTFPHVRRFPSHLKTHASIWQQCDMP